MTRLWFADGSYMDIGTDDLPYYECDPELHHIEYMTEMDPNGNAAHR